VIGMCSEAESRNPVCLNTLLSSGSRDERRFCLIMMALAALVASLTFLGGCTNDRPSSPAGYLQVDIATAPSSLDPRLATDAISSRIDELIYDPMVKLDAGGRPRGDLAERIEQPDATRLIFHLRHGVRFSNGGPVTARDVVYTYDSIRNPVTH